MLGNEKISVCYALCSDIFTGFANESHVIPVSIIFNI